MPLLSRVLHFYPGNGPDSFPWIFVKHIPDYMLQLPRWPQYKTQYKWKTESMTNTNFKAIRKQGWHDSAEWQKIQVSTDLSDNCIPKSDCLTQNCLLHFFLFQQKYCNPSTCIVPHLQWCKVVELPWSIARAWWSGWKSVIKCPWRSREVEHEPKDWTIAVLSLTEEF
jgi:hypothetical protein